MAKKSKGRKEDRGSERTAKVLVAGLLVIMLAIPVIAFIASLQPDGGEGPAWTGPGSDTGDSSMGSEARQLWEDYLSEASPIDVTPENPAEWRSSSVDPSFRDDLPDSEGWNASSPAYSTDDEGGDGKDAGGNEAPAQDDSDRSDDDSSEEREVEESDIVKAVGNRMIVLNPYRGLVVVNLEEPEKPYIEGRINVPGYPVSMYVVDFLGFIIVSEAPALRGGIAESTGRLYIVDLMEPSDPRVVSTVDIIGYPVDSRRVGGVIYVISNEYPMYYWEDQINGIAEDSISSKEVAVEDMPTETTNIVSISFLDPLSIGEKDREEFPGSSGMVHASQYAIIVPQNKWNEEGERTRFIYVDISDPAGDIAVRGSIEVPGYLNDRYQMDIYDDTFRAVTQQWPRVWSEENRFPASTLYTMDVSDPDNIRQLGKLLIDDEGNLMATRFAGDRAYTIHLPQSLDPLDVIDLSDPINPQLKDILEIPGWVEHLEVLGYNILAVGVDTNATTGWNVALYLFDVADASDAKLEDRVIIGEGNTYSEANYDPKALTILKERGLVLVPYSSYNWWGGGIGQEYGVMIVSFDLDQGDLKVRGKVLDDSPIKRSREVNGYLITTSESRLLSIDASDLDVPVIKGIVDLSYYVTDVFMSGGKVVSLIGPSWIGSGVKIVVTDPKDPYKTLLEVKGGGLFFEGIMRSGKTVYLKGIRQGEGIGSPTWEITAYDMSDPLSPVDLGTVKIPIAVDPTYPPVEPRVYEEANSSEGGKEETAPPEPGTGTTPGDDDDVSDDVIEEPKASPPMVTYDPFSMTVLSDGSILVYNANYYWYAYEGYYKGNISGEAQDNYNLITWSEEPRVTSFYLPPISYYYQGQAFGSGDMFIVSYSDWWPPMSHLVRVTIEDGSVDISGTIDLRGRLVGVSSDLRYAYTQAEWYGEGNYYNTLNAYDISGEPEYLKGIDLEQGVYVSSVSDTMIIASHTPYYYYWGYRGGYGIDDVAFAEGDGVITKGMPQPGDQTVPDTTIYAIMLKDGVFDTVTKHSISGYYSVAMVKEGIVLLSGYRELTGLKVSPDGSVESMGPWYITGSVVGGSVQDNMLLLALGQYGFELLTI